MDRAVIDVMTLGPPSVIVDGGDPPRELLWKKNLALLVYLALSPGRRRAREHLVGLLWGDKNEAKARHSLNEALRVLRRAGGSETVLSSGDHVVLDEGRVRLDVDAFRTAVSEDALEKAARLVRGPFMEGFFVEGSSTFEDWLHAERTQLSGMSVTTLRELAETALARGDSAEARTLANRALALDPLSEDSLRVALLSRALAGERAQAVALFDEFARRLDTELGITPGDDLLGLMDRIRQEKSWRLPVGVPDADRTARRPPLVGRSDALGAVLQAVSDAVRTRRPALVMLLGDPGVGKTRLIEELLARVRMAGVRTAGVRPIVADRELAGSAVEHLERGVRSLTDTPDRGAGLVGAIEDAASSDPLLIWIDDAELADDASLSTVHRLLRDVPDAPVAVVLTASETPGAPVLDELRAAIGRDVPGEVVVLRPFTAEQVLELSRSILPQLTEEGRERLSRRVFADSAGLPLLSLELLNAVRLGLELNRIEGTWPQPFRTMASTFPGDLPDSVVAAIRVGFRRLSSDGQSVLAAASILGERIGVSRIREATGLDESRLTAALDELEWQRWLTSDTLGYSFVARVVRDVIAQDMLTPGQRRRILVAAGLLDD